jgi:hypothetical protein
MCDFRPGDEVAYIENDWPKYGLVKNAVYIIAEVLPPIFGNGECGVHLQGFPNPTPNPRQGFMATMFRKVQKPKASLKIESFLTIKPGFEEPRRVETPVKETA